MHIDTRFNAPANDYEHSNLRDVSHHSHSDISNDDNRNLADDNPDEFQRVPDSYHSYHSVRDPDVRHGYNNLCVSDPDYNHGVQCSVRL